VTARSGGELRWAVRDHLADPARRGELAGRGRRAVLERHTFGHRVDAILADLATDEPRLVGGPGDRAAAS
jgi:spore maturation protein CgeB